MSRRTKHAAHRSHPYCPGSTKPAEIAKNQLRYLQFVVQGRRRNRKIYTYWNAHRIAQDPNMDFGRKTMVLAIGYLDSVNFGIARTFAGLYEDLNYNVILTDYQRFSTVHYPLASRLMRPVGKHIGEILANLTSQGLDSSKLELLGFSLGGQTVSFVAKRFRDITGTNVSRITALEPSGPCFRTLGPEERLDASDADFVDVIHTNIDGYGMATPLGHVNFYVNGGEYQPSQIDFIPCDATCSHFKCLPIWFSAVKNPGKFVAVRCRSVQNAREHRCDEGLVKETNVLGLEVDRNRPGIYYLATTGTYPYYLGSRALKGNVEPAQGFALNASTNDTVVSV
ncbi:Lipase member H-B [Eumeta japonica]|uniref:Lipase member H-B n=1 Tax=Eumeta variegata TaxID=151549 RepID=A0A4C1Z494_EUMVA|nr:Lipase member H-B [Eumeta japonica]